jgi:hypothetical protein
MNRYSVLLILILMPLLIQPVQVHAVECYVKRFDLDLPPSTVALNSVFTVTATIVVMCTGSTGEFITTKIIDRATGNVISETETVRNSITYTSNVVNMTENGLTGLRVLEFQASIDGASTIGTASHGWMMTVQNILLPPPSDQSEDHGGGGDGHGGHCH